MRILMIIDGLSGGGAEKVLLTLAKGFLEQGNQVSIFSLKEVCDYILPDGVEYKVVIDRFHGSFGKLTELSRRARALDKAVLTSKQRNGEFDLIVSHLHKTDRIVARSRVLSRDRVWFCLHTVFSLSYLSSRKGFSRWIKRYKVHELYKNRNIVAVSAGVLNDICKVFKIKPRLAKVIYNPFDFSAIRKLAQAPCELSDQNYLIHVARLHENKRQDRLLEAYAKSGIQAPLVILGKGSDVMLNRLKLLSQDLNITNRVFFKEFKNNPYPYIFHARMLILSSDSEGFGNVLIEALICNTPVVSTRCLGGPTEILNGNLSTGLADLNSDSLAKTIRKIYNQPQTVLPIHLKMYQVETICREYISLTYSTP